MLLNFKNNIKALMFRIYMEFLRWCLHPNDVIPASVSDIDWKGLLSFAKKQTIVGIYWQGIQRLGDIANKPSEDDVMEWMGEYQNIVRRNSNVDKEVIKLVSFLEDMGIKFFIFKGQSVAQYYPIPESRTSGDVDFYVFRQYQEKANNLLKEKVDIEDTHNLRHVEFTSNSIPFEMHYHTATFAGSSRQKYWDGMIDELSAVLDIVNIKNVSIPVLPPTVYAIYLFTHIYRHFLKDGIGLRQFIDWMMFFEAKHKEIVVPELTAKLNKLGLLRAFKAFGAILTEVLGMDAACLPYSLTESDKRYVDKIMTIVLRYGNFGKYGRKEQQGGWKHSVETGMMAVRHITQFFWLSPAENLLWIPKLICRSLMKNAIRSN